MNNKKYVRLSGIIYESMVNGTGIRRVIFAQGCIHNCKGCFNPETHPLQGGELVDMNQLIEDVVSNPMLTGVTFSGGDPFEQAKEFAYIAREIKNSGKDIWCYTGYTFEDIIKNLKIREGWEELLYNIDVLIDGKFEKEKIDKKIKYRGSTNQRIIDVKNSLNEGKVLEKEI
ncbi:anaerobic ribonucleoside-triphosphate reductase activating protein [Clostridium sediminicola]|uniref:anaerobic ribonucleoside-triphosphate reductase activating protein n=1 Tax=Clostridium sediminicola TaxID=3114879 RepID=UPI0031F2354E